MTPRSLVPLTLAGALLASSIAITASQGEAQDPTPTPRQNLAVDATTAFRDDVHASVGLTCDTCHTAPGTAPDGRIVYAPITRTDIPALCATCHADAAYMRRFAVQVRVDQYTQYQTSVHGQRLAAGDDQVATCSDCHGAHGVRRVSDARAPVAPSHVADTCARCHADADRMGPYGRSAEVVDHWKGSVHAAALLERGDTSAPTCNTCHGSHGATPPGIEAVANVCAQCHVREAELFQGSIKGAVFDMMGLADCLVCHSNHAIEPPNATWIGLESPAVCATCHADSTPSGETILAMRAGFDTLLTRTDEAGTMLTRAEEAGMLVTDGELALHDAVEAHVRMRVAVHGFSRDAYEEILEEGLSAAESAEHVGVSALEELNYRRRGLAIATLLILGFLVTLYLKIRSLPPIEEP